MSDEMGWWVGIDWASEQHRVCLLDDTGRVIGERTFAHGGAGLAALCDWLLATTGAAAAEIAVAIERGTAQPPSA